MNPVMFIIVFLLFWSMIPGAIVVLPSTSSEKWIIYAVHSFLFTVILALIYKPLCRYTSRLGLPSFSLEGMENPMSPPKNSRNQNTQK